MFFIYSRLSNFIIIFYSYVTFNSKLFNILISWQKFILLLLLSISLSLTLIF